MMDHRFGRRNSHARSRFQITNPRGSRSAVSGVYRRVELPQLTKNILSFVNASDRKWRKAAVRRQTASCDSSLSQNSLLFAEKSLFLEIFSLLISVGNFTKSHCSAAVSCSEIRP